MIHNALALSVCENSTALHVCALRGDGEGVAALLAAGANTSAADNSQQVI